MRKEEKEKAQQALLLAEEEAKKELAQEQAAYEKAEADYAEALEKVGLEVKTDENGNPGERYMTADQTLRNNIMKYSIKAQKRAAIAKGQRDLSKLVSANQANTVAINGDLHMVLTQGSKTTILTPNGADQAYNWAILSPDGT